MRRIYSLFALCALFLFITPHAYATDYTIGDNQTTSDNNLLPFSIGSGYNDSFTQQLYLASELTAKGAATGNITAISFKYVGASSSTLSNPNRSNVEVWIRPVSITSFPNGYGYGPSNKDKSAGTKYFEGSVTLPTTANTWYTITLDNAFAWDGTSNIIVTINDKTNSQTNGWARNHLVYSATNRGIYAAANSAAHDASAAYDIAGTRISYVPVIKFTFEDSGSSIPLPTSPSVDNETTNSADIHWTAAEGADSYSIRYRTSVGAYGEAIDIPGGGSVTSYTLSGLEDGITYYYQIRTNVGSDYSEWTDEDSFSTLVITHIHDGISFSKWASTTSMPTSGNYYLANNVALAPYDPTTITLTDDLNLCLNGNTANLYGTKIVVPDGITLAIYDNVGGGKLTGFVASDVGAFDIYAKALIVVFGGGELELHQGTIENTYVPDEDGSSYAIYSNGTLHLSGDVLINSNDADIYLYSTNVITLDGAISNAEKHTVYKTGGAITSGWSTYMSSADPRDYFESANSARSVCLNEGEASLRLLLTLSESNPNSSISTSYNQLVDVNLTRSLTSSQYNTFCLPFALDDDQLEEIFGAGYDLRQLESSSFDGEMLNLVFSDPLNALEAGKPYLIQPSQNVVNPSFEGVTITAILPINVETSYVDFKGNYAPTELTKDNKNQLFLDAGNELKYPVATANLKGFRAYFELKGDAAVSLSPVRARIVMQEDAATGLEQTSQEPRANSQKLIKDGQLIIERNGTLYNAQGQVIK